MTPRPTRREDSLQLMHSQALVGGDGYAAVARKEPG